MTEDFRRHYINVAAAALVAALPTGANAKPASRGTTAAQVAASFDMDHNEDDHDVYIETVPRKGHGHLDCSLVDNVLVAQMMQDRSLANNVLVAKMMQRQWEV
jgi:hypothetical protein